MVVSKMKKMILASLYRVTKSDVEKASLVLGRAFHDDPVMSQVVPEEDERKQKLPLIYKISLLYALKYGGAYSPSKNLEGIAIIVPSETANVTFWRLIRSGALRTVIKLGRGTFNRLERILAPMIKAQKEILKEGYLYLQIMGVSPELQGRGFGGKLVRSLIEHADNEETAIYLETTENNVQWYKKFGFRVLKEIKLPAIDLSMWAMVRET